MARGYRRNHYGKHSPYSRKGKIGDVKYITSLEGHLIQCAICGEKWHDNWLDVDGVEMCWTCYDTMSGNICEICGLEFAKGITIQRYKNGFAHPECILGVPIDHGD